MTDDTVQSALVDVGFLNLTSCTGSRCFNMSRASERMLSEESEYEKYILPVFLQHNLPGPGGKSNTEQELYAPNHARNDTVVMGPWFSSEGFGLLSMTKPIFAPSGGRIMGWITCVLGAKFFVDFTDRGVHSGNTGQVLLIGASRYGNKFSQPLSSMTEDEMSKQYIRFLVPPTDSKVGGFNHRSRPNIMKDTFPISKYGALKDALMKDITALSGANSALSTKNEQGKVVTVASAFINYKCVDWIVALEQSKSETLMPITQFQRLVVWEVATSMVIIIMVSFPLAHFYVRPIRQLREATQRTIQSDELVPGGGHSPDDDSGASGARSNQNEKKQLFDRIHSKIHSALQRFGYKDVGNLAVEDETESQRPFRIPGKVVDRKHFIHDELTDLTGTFNAMSDELIKQYQKLDQKVKERTKELEISKKAAEAANDSKTLFLANLSHELKTPLNHIMGLSALCMQEEDKGKIRRSLRIMYKSGDLLLHLLTDLLTFSKNEIGQQLNLNEHEFRLGDIGTQVVSLYEEQTKERGIELRVTYHSPRERTDMSQYPTLSETDQTVGDMWLWGDQHRILQVLINLVGNSLKFTPKGGSVEVRVICCGEPDLTSEQRCTNFGSHPVTSRQSKRRNSLTHCPSTSSSIKRRSLQDSSPHTACTTAASARTTRNSQSSHPSPSDSSSQDVNMRDISRSASQKYIPKTDKQPFPKRTLSKCSQSPSLSSKSNRLFFEFEVIDTGPGIPEHQQKSVFEPFNQGDLGLNKKFGGTGLGLSICSQLACLMGGTISLESQLGKGSKFTLRIPLGCGVRKRSDSLHSLIKPLSNSRAPSHEDATTVIVRQGSIDSARSSSPTTTRTDAIPMGSQNSTSIRFSTPFSERRPNASTTKTAASVMTISNLNTDRVLVAEDNSINQEIILRMLKRENVSGIV